MAPALADILTSRVILALACLALLLFGSALWVFRRKRGSDIGGADPVGGYLAFARNDQPVSVWIAWTLVSVLVIVLGGMWSYWVGGQGSQGIFLANADQALNAANYIFVVPVLVGAYVWFLRLISERFPFHADAAARRNFIDRPTFRYLAITILTLGIAFLAIRSEFQFPSTDSPWVRCAGLQCACASPNRDLSLAGISFYILRAIDTSMALGLIWTLTIVYYQRKGRFERSIRPLVDRQFPGLGPTEAIRDVGGALVLLASLGSTVTFLHGASLFVQARKVWAIRASLCTDSAANLFFGSTWLLWLIATFFASALCLLIVLWLREQICDELRELEERDAKALPADLAARYDMEAKIAQKYDKAETWPLPVGASVGFFIALLGQLGNFLFALVSLLVKA